MDGDKQKTKHTLFSFRSPAANHLDRLKLEGGCMLQVQVRLHEQRAEQPVGLRLIAA